MAQVAPLVLRVLASSVTAANRAGQIIRDVMQKGDLGIIEKGKNDLQTEADRSAQRCIIASLIHQFPGISVIGEEGALDLEVLRPKAKVPNDWLVTSGCPVVLASKCPEEFDLVLEKDIVVWVDPLDGTSEYTQGFLEHVTVLIGVSVKAEAVGGVIHQPYYSNAADIGRTIWGLKGLGVGGITPTTPPKDKFIVTTTRTHSTPLVQSALDALKPDEIIKVGGAGYKVLQLIEGKAHAYVFASAGCKKWDTCAPEAILQASGGVLTDILGEHYSYDSSASFPNNRGVLATANGVPHIDVVNKIPQEVRDVMNQR